jgi:NADPH:quinone reductase-like Zn-dependent oxidoreductase
MPVPKRGEVRISVEAAGVAFGDVAQRRGAYFGGAPAMPYTPGYDVVGSVDAIGDDVSEAAVGDRVAALTLFGGYARYVCVPAEWAVKVPPPLDAAKAVALVLNSTTAWQLMRRVALVRDGDAILVYGGSGGVGTALLDLATRLSRGEVHHSCEGRCPIAEWSVRNTWKPIDAEFSTNLRGQDPPLWRASVFRD